MIEFLTNYWKYIILFAVIGLDVLVQFIKKPKVVDGAWSLTLDYLPVLIKTAETLFPSSGEGSKKLDWVVDMALAYYGSLGGSAVASHRHQIIESIEKILDTPEKK